MSFSKIKDMLKKGYDDAAKSGALGTKAKVAKEAEEKKKKKKGY